MSDEIVVYLDDLNGKIPPHTLKALFAMVCTYSIFPMDIVVFNFAASPLLPAGKYRLDRDRHGFTIKRID